MMVSFILGCPGFREKVFIQKFHGDGIELLRVLEIADVTAALQEGKTKIVTAAQESLQFSKEGVILRAADEKCVLKAVNDGLENRHVVSDQGEPGHEFLPAQLFAVFSDLFRDFLIIYQRSS